eukprot:UN07084
MPARCARISEDCIVNQHSPNSTYLQNGKSYTDLFTYDDNRLLAIVGEHHGTKHNLAFHNIMAVQFELKNLKYR